MAPKPDFNYQVPYIRPPYQTGALQRGPGVHELEAFTGHWKTACSASGV